MLLLFAVAVLWGVVLVASRDEVVVGLLKMILALGGAALVLWVVISSVFWKPDGPGPAAASGLRTAVPVEGPNAPNLSEPDAGRQAAAPPPGPSTISSAAAPVATSNPTTDGTSPATAISTPTSFTADFHKYVAGAWLSPDELPFAAAFSWQSNGQTPVGATGVIQQDWYSCNPTGKDWGYDPATDAVQAANFAAPSGKPQAELEERMIFFADPQAASHALGQIAADFTACKAVNALPGFGMEGIELVKLNKTATIDGGFAYLHTARRFDGSRGNGVGHWGTDAHEYFVQRGNILVLISLFAQNTAGGEVMDATTTDAATLQQMVDHLVTAYAS